MNNTLLIVITRLTASKGTGLDEFVYDWITPQEDARERKGFLFDDDALKQNGYMLLLVHGHDGIKKDHICKTVEEALNEAKQKDKKEINQSECNLSIFVHGREKEVYDFNGLFGKSDLRPFRYSSQARESATLGILGALKKDGISENICDEIADKCLNPARLQTLYLNQIRELLLALQLNVAINKKESIQDSEWQQAVTNIEKMLKKIENFVQRPVMQIKGFKTDESANHQRIFAIWDITEQAISKERMSKRGSFDKYDPPWYCKDFWDKYCQGDDISESLKTLDIKAFENDLRYISAGIGDLLKRVGIRENRQ